MENKKISGLNVDYTNYPQYDSLTYILMPIEIDDKSVVQWCETSKSNIVIITGMDWDNDLTPWPALAVPKGTGNFKGLAPAFLHRLESEIIPQIETEVKAQKRNLIGVSLSGLFALWAWMQDDTFTDICSLSGSFWYSGFVEWLQKYDIPKKEGKILFELGTLEPKSKQPVFATVGRCTEAVVSRLEACGIDVKFTWVPGTHYSPIEPRLRLAFQFLGSW